MTNQPRTEIQLPVSYDAIRSWVDRMQVESPVGYQVDSGEGYRQHVTYEVGAIHGGAEVTFYDGDDRALHTLVFYGEPSEADAAAEDLILVPRLYCAADGCSHVVKVLSESEQEAVAREPHGFVVYCRDHSGQSIREPAEPVDHGGWEDS